MKSDDLVDSALMKNGVGVNSDAVAKTIRDLAAVATQTSAMSIKAKADSVASVGDATDAVYAAMKEFAEIILEAKKTHTAALRDLRDTRMALVEESFEIDKAVKRLESLPLASMLAHMKELKSILADPALKSLLKELLNA